MEAELGEMLVGTGEFAVLLGLAAVVSKLNFEPSHYAMRRQAKNSVGWAFEHLDQAPGKGAVD